MTNKLGTSINAVWRTIMKYQNLFTFKSLSNYLSGLTNHLKNIPGCKVKHAHLIEAASLVEGQGNSDRLAATSTNIPEAPFKYTRKQIIFKYIKGEVKISNIEVDMQPEGFWSAEAITLSASQCVTDFKLRDIRLCFGSGEHSDGNTLSELERNICLTVALNEATALFAWLESFKKDDELKYIPPELLDTSWEVVLFSDDELPNKEEISSFLERKGTRINLSGYASYIAGKGNAVTPARLITLVDKSPFALLEGNEKEFYQIAKGNSFNLNKVKLISVLLPNDIYPTNPQELGEIGRRAYLDYGQDWPAGSIVEIDGIEYEIVKHESKKTHLKNDLREQAIHLLGHINSGWDVKLLSIPNLKDVYNLDT